MILMYQNDRKHWTISFIEGEDTKAAEIAYSMRYGTVYLLPPAEPPSPDGARAPGAKAEEVSG